MTLNATVFVKDPTKFRIPNDGVARVGIPSTTLEWDTLRWELQSFVCEGEYHDGLDRILSSYLGSLGKPKQPSVWVSGFYGSGKSHLLRVLDALWRDVSLPGGASARGLTDLPAEIRAHLAELSTAGKREGGLWSAVGTLSTGVGSSVRIAVLSIVFKSAQLPETLAPARFVLWLEAEGHRVAVEQALTARGKTLGSELTNMYVSQPLAEAILAVIPGFATSSADVHQLLREQYKGGSEIGSTEFVQLLRKVFKLRSTHAERLPLVLIVLDELQQFLSEDPNRTLELQDIVERCSAEFEGRVLFVGSGQMQLGSTPALQKVRDRFTVKVALGDEDVDRVVRAVVLRKDPTRLRELEQTLDRASGEISRQLGGSRIAQRAADAAYLVADYPLLPSRRRLWEAILRSVDSVGKAGQLRAQLRIVLEATKAVANEALGRIITADAIYDPIEADLQQSAVLPRDTATLIASVGTSGTDRSLRTGIAKLAFLLSKLEEGGPVATGIKATAETFADLLVADLAGDSSDLRRRVAEVIDQLVGEGILLEVGGQYLLQTPVAAEWLQAFAREFTRLKGDAAATSERRSQAMKAAVADQLNKLGILQGKAKVPRKTTVVYGDTAPPASLEVPIWLRDGWSTAAAEVLRDAQAAGTDSPIVFVFVPRADQDAIQEAIASAGAARAVVDGRPMPQTAEGSDARAGIASRGNLAEQRLAGLMAGLLSQARVYQGGGNEVSAGSFRASIEQAATDALSRMFPGFSDGDSDAWAKVIERSKQGNPKPLDAIGYNGDPRLQPACAEVMRFLMAGARTGKDIRMKFMSLQYGWPQDAVDGVLYALTSAGAVRARQNATTVQAKSMAQNTLGSVTFQLEGVMLSATAKIEVKALATRLGMQVANMPDADVATGIVGRLNTMANDAGGGSPLPAVDAPELLTRLQHLGGNELIQAVFDAKDQLTSLADRWDALAKKKASRLEAWTQLQTLKRYTADGDGEVSGQMAAIESARTLLSDPDPVAPLVQKLAEELRGSIVQARDAYLDAEKTALQALTSDEMWRSLDDANRLQITQSLSLGQGPGPGVDTVVSLLAATAHRSPAEWQTRLVALPALVSKARENAARIVAPEAVTMRAPSATIATDDELKAYLQRLEAEVTPHLRAGKRVIVQ